MHHDELIVAGTTPARRRNTLGSAVALALAAMATAPSALAFEFDTGSPDLKVRWDNTVKYSAGVRLKAPSSVLTAGVSNGDDGDRNFKKGGLISNRFDLFSELDLTYKNVGMRVSGAAWYDNVYNRSNSNDSPLTANAASAPYNEFTDATRKLHGRTAELLDAFVFGKGDLGDMGVTGRAGKHTVLFGESLFFGNNGIAAAQATIDVVKALSVPSTQFKELMRPVQQLSGQIQVRPNLALGAYYQTRWQRDRLPAVGSYFSSADLLDAGGERILAGPNAIIPGGPPFSFSRTGDLEAKGSGQGGMQVRYRPEGQDIEFGLYAARYHSKAPVAYLYPGAGFNPVTGQVGTYQLAFPENIKTYGASFSTTVGDANVAGEISFRRDMPLVAQGGSVVVPFGVTADNRDNPLYPIGNTAHMQISWIALLKPAALWQGGSFVGEVAWHRRLSVTKNATALEPNATRDATAIRMVFEPAYYQVLNGLDVTVPIGIGYGLFGKSSVLNPGFSTYHGGDLSVGLKGDYLKVWKFGLIYTHFLGGEAATVTPQNAFSYGQSLKDRNFISLNVQHTF